MMSRRESSGTSLLSITVVRMVPMSSWRNGRRKHRSIIRLSLQPRRISADPEVSISVRSMPSNMMPIGVFLADDDAYADKDMVKNFWEFTEKHDCSKYSVVAAEVLSMDGTVCLYHRYRYKVSNLVHFNLTASVKEDYDQEYFDFDIVSYVGPFVNGKAMKEVGTVLPQYFIYCDDGEHSLRLAKYGKLICVPSIKITHESGAEKANANQDIVVSWRNYYQDRNMENMMKRHFPLVALYSYLRFMLISYPHHPFSPNIKLKSEP